MWSRITCGWHASGLLQRPATGRAVCAARRTVYRPRGSPRESRPSCRRRSTRRSVRTSPTNWWTGLTTDGSASERRRHLQISSTSRASTPRSTSAWPNSRGARCGTGDAAGLHHRVNRARPILHGPVDVHVPGAHCHRDRRHRRRRRCSRPQSGPIGATSGGTAGVDGLGRALRMLPGKGGCSHTRRQRPDLVLQIRWGCQHTGGTRSCQVERPG